ncbi:hypothetical protein HGO37_25965 [Rhizobium sp. CG4]|uniref:ABC-three component system middle component 1 n=1 Tax=Rhizobium sp. CG4 TaxID=2726075 RepID=UPI0020348527|nr:ABC-three component system middle component 1 [Rhizobium sp. CG4]MCM2458834.1 hypothetical protein [Rhizobium sp. CG4]
MSESSATSPVQKTLDTVQGLLAARAIHANLAVEVRPEFAGRIFAGGSDTPSARIEASDLPNHVRGFQLGRYPVLLTMLPEAPDEEEIRDVVRRVRNQCVVIRSYLSPQAALDLHAILLGPRGSESVDRWRALALIAERDERVARKLVWLRPKDAAADERSFEDFSKRTFLSRPWVTRAIFSMAPLDNVSSVASYGDVPRDTAGEWIRAASEPGVEADQLVGNLVASWQRRSAK